MEFWHMYARWDSCTAKDPVLAGSFAVFLRVYRREYNYLDSHSNTIYIVNMIDKKLTSDLLRGHTDTIILKFLVGGDKYGYEITKLVHELSDHEYELKEATMYSSLKRLENDEHITSYWGDETQGGRRKYYRITPSGKQQYDENIRNWQYAQVILDKLL